MKKRVKAGSQKKERGGGGGYITGMSHFLRWRSAVCVHIAHRSLRAKGFLFSLCLAGFHVESTFFNTYSRSHGCRYTAFGISWVKIIYHCLIKPV